MNRDEGAYMLSRTWSAVLGGSGLTLPCDLLRKTEVYPSKHVKVKKITSANIRVCDKRKFETILYSVDIMM